MTSYYVVNAIVITNSSFVGGNWVIEYKFYLNNTNDQGNIDKLPLFTLFIYNFSNNQISNRTAVENGNWTIATSETIVENLYMLLDNQRIDLGEFKSEKLGTSLNMNLTEDAEINKTMTIDGLLKDAFGNYLSGKIVKLLLNGIVIANQTTDSKGKYHLTILSVLLKIIYSNYFSKEIINISNQKH